jgi:hypothetical protein
MFRPSYPPRLNHLHNIWFTLQIIQLPFTKFSESSSHFLPLMHKYLPQHPVLEHTHLCSCLNVTDQVSHPYKTTRKITALYIVIFMSLGSKKEDKRFCPNGSRRTHLLVMCSKKLRADCSQAVLAVIRCRMFCLPVCYPKI